MDEFFNFCFWFYGMLVLVIGNLVFGFTIAIVVAVAFAYKAFFF